MPLRPMEMGPIRSEERTAVSLTQTVLRGIPGRRAAVVDLDLPVDRA